jgi:hypothetical protein
LLALGPALSAQTLNTERTGLTSDALNALLAFGAALAAWAGHADAGNSRRAVAAVLSRITLVTLETGRAFWPPFTALAVAQRRQAIGDRSHELVAQLGDLGAQTVGDGVRFRLHPLALTLPGAPLARECFAEYLAPRVK